MGVIKRLVVSTGEDRLYKLAKTALGERVHLKVRLADVFDISAEGWAEDEREFMLMSHFDILVTDDDLNPKFAAEYDGRYHQETIQSIRDELKNRICRKAVFRLVRVQSDDLQDHEGLIRRLKLAELPVYVGYLERILCLNAAIKLISIIGFSLWNNSELIKNTLALAVAFEDTGWLRPSEEDSQQYFESSAKRPMNHQPWEWLPDNSQVRLRYQIISTAIDSWPSFEKEVRAVSPFPDATYSAEQVMDITRKFASWINS